MANTRELRRRIKSVKNTSQITKAMQMVSATKMRKAQVQAISGRPYSSTLSYALSAVSGKIDPSMHLLLQPNGSSKIGILVLSTDKGLCGALNTNLLRSIQSSDNFKGKDIIYYTIGKKGRDFIVRTGKNLQADFESTEHINFSEGIKVRKMMLEAFLNAEVGEIYLAYPHFVSTLRQEPKIVKILPIAKESLTSFFDIKDTQVDDVMASCEFVFEPGADAVLDYALTHLIDTQIYQALLEMRASEHSARMIAMQNATNNAKDLVADLNLSYNQIRQSAVTTELLEITSAQAALE